MQRCCFGPGIPQCDSWDAENSLGLTACIWMSQGSSPSCKWQGSPHSWQIKAVTLSQHYSKRHEFSREMWHSVLHQHWRKAEAHRATVPPHHHHQAGPWQNYTHWVCFKWSSKKSPTTPTRFGKTGYPSCRWWTRARTLTPWWEERALAALGSFASKRGVTTIPSFYGCWGVNP